MCWNAATDQAIAQINVEDGNDFKPYELERPCEDENSWALLENSPLFDRPLADRQALRDRYDAARWRASFERGCALGFKHLEPVTDGQRIDVQLVPRRAPIAVQLF